MRKVPFPIVFFVLLLLTIPVYAQDTPVVTVDFRELRFSPEDTAPLTTDHEAFLTNPTLVSLLDNNSTMFWEEIGAFDSNLMADSTVTSIAVVAINDTGFFQTIIAFNHTDGELEWIRSLNATLSANYTLAVRTATDFFADDGHYWGICEDLILLPGSTVGQAVSVLWRFKFYLVGETERWTLLIDTNGELVTFQFEDVPCQSCNDSTPFVIVGFAGAIVLVVLIAFYFKNRNS